MLYSKKTKELQCQLRLFLSTLLSLHAQTSVCEVVTKFLHVFTYILHVKLLHVKVLHVKNPDSSIICYIARNRKNCNVSYVCFHLLC